MTITYIYGKSLYVNITNRCTNNCDFCIRTHNDGFYSKDPLWLEREPTREEILSDISGRNPDTYKELVFCGYGEPTRRLADMLWVCRKVKEKYSVPIRLNTNGHCNLIYGDDMTPLFEGAIDVVSVSLNTANAADYERICHSDYGEDAYPALIDFARRVRPFVRQVVLTVVRTTIFENDIEICRKIAEENGVELRVRELI